MGVGRPEIRITASLQTYVPHLRMPVVAARQTRTRTFPSNPTSLDRLAMLDLQHVKLDLEGHEFETDEENLAAWRKVFGQRHYW
jgi:hypothetical protein